MSHEPVRLDSGRQRPRLGALARRAVPCHRQGAAHRVEGAGGPRQDHATLRSSRARDAPGRRSSCVSASRATPTKLQEWHASVRAALGFSGDETAWSVSAAARRSRSPPSWCRAHRHAPARRAGARRAQRRGPPGRRRRGRGRGHLLAPAVVAGVEQTGTAKAISELFAVEEPPALVLVTPAGGCCSPSAGAGPRAGGSPSTSPPRWSGATRAPAVSWRRSPRWSPRTASPRPTTAPPRS